MGGLLEAICSLSRPRDLPPDRSFPRKSNASRDDGQTGLRFGNGLGNWGRGQTCDDFGVWLSEFCPLGRSQETALPALLQPRFWKSHPGGAPSPPISTQPTQASGCRQSGPPRVASPAAPHPQHKTCHRLASWSPLGRFGRSPSPRPSWNSVSRTTNLAPSVPLVVGTTAPDSTPFAVGLTVLGPGLTLAWSPGCLVYRPGLQATGHDGSTQAGSPRGGYVMLRMGLPPPPLPWTLKERPFQRRAGSGGGQSTPRRSARGLPPVQRLEAGLLLGALATPTLTAQN